MMKSIRVIPERRTVKLNEISRINFAKTYTVEHNVKVLEFGKVHKDSMLILLNQWRWVLDCNTDAIVDASDVKALIILAVY